MSKVKFYLSLRWQLFLLCLIILLPVIIVTSYLLYQYNKEILAEEKHSKLLTAVTLVSEQFSGSDLAGLASARDPDSESYQTVKQQLNNLKGKLSYIRNIYIIGQTGPTTATYLVESAEEPSEDLFSTINLNNEPALQEGFSQSSVNNVTFTDKDGLWFRAYAPIVNNDIPAVLAMDMYFTESTDEYFYNLLSYLFLLSILSFFILSFLATRLFTYPIKKVNESLNKMSNGDFSNKIPFNWAYGETGELVKSANQINTDLQNYMQRALENKEQLEEKNRLTQVANKQIKSKNYQLNSTLLTLNAINNLIEQLILVEDTEELMSTALPATMDLVKAEKAFIVEYIPEKKQYIILNTCNTSVVEKEQVLSAGDGYYLNKILDTKNYLNLHEPGKIKGEEFINALIFPLIVQKEVKGMICLINKGSEETKFNDEDEATIKTLSKLISATWDSIHSFELATIDNLTSLFIKGYFEKNMIEEVKKTQRNQTKLSLIFLDIDSLKFFNEKYNHLVGDQIIKEVAAKIKNNTDEYDQVIAARYSSEEFIILMPETELFEAYELAERIRADVETVEIDEVSNEDRITVSAGVASLPENAKTMEGLLGTVKENLAKAKEEGKNMVSMPS